MYKTPAMWFTYHNLQSGCIFLCYSHILHWWCRVKCEANMELYSLCSLHSKCILILCQQRLVGLESLVLIPYSTYYWCNFTPTVDIHPNPFPRCDITYRIVLNKGSLRGDRHQAGPRSPEEQHRWFSVIFAHFHPFSPIFASKFHQNFGVGCLKELKRNISNTDS